MSNYITTAELEKHDDDFWVGRTVQFWNTDNLGSNLKAKYHMTDVIIRGVQRSLCRQNDALPDQDWMYGLSVRFNDGRIESLACARFRFYYDGIYKQEQ